MASVLIVDDAHDATELLAAIMRRCGHNVRCATNGREALAEVLKETPDVIVLDLQMPVMDGRAFLEVLRSYVRLARLPVVVFSALSDGLLMEKIRALHVDSVLLKGNTSPQQILGAVTDAVEHRPHA